MAKVITYGVRYRMEVAAMNLTAKAVPYSSVVGGSLTLVDDTGKAQFMVLFSGTSLGISTEQANALSLRIGELINEHGLAVPSHAGKP